MTRQEPSAVVQSRARPVRIVAAAIAESVGGAVLVLLGLAELLMTSWSGLWGVSGGLISWGVLMLLSSVGLYFQNGIARVTSVILSALAAGAGLFVLAQSGSIPVSIWLSMACSLQLISGALVLFAVATTADWGPLLGYPTPPPMPPTESPVLMSSEPGSTPIRTSLESYVLRWTVIGLVLYGLVFVGTLFESGPSTAISQMGWLAAWGLFGALMFRGARSYGARGRRPFNRALAIPGVPALLLVTNFVFGQLFTNVIQATLRMLGITF